MKYYKNFNGMYFNLNHFTKIYEDFAVCGLMPNGEEIRIEARFTTPSIAFLNKLMWAYLFSSKTLITYEYVISLPDDIMDKEAQ